MKELKNMKGITLVSLVITIIVLIILAAVSINLTIGTDGIITRAKEAAENMEIAALEEQEMLNTLYDSFEGDVVIGDTVSSNKFKELKQQYDALTQEHTNFKTQIAQAITNKGVETSSQDSVETMVSNIGEIKTSGEVELAISKVWDKGTGPENAIIGEDTNYQWQNTSTTINENNTFYVQSAETNCIYAKKPGTYLTYYLFANATPTYSIVTVTEEQISSAINNRVELVKILANRGSADYVIMAVKQ